MMSASSPAADVAGMAVVAPAKKEIVEPEQLGSAVKPEFVAKTEFEQEVVKKEPLSKVTSAALFGEGSVPSKGGGRGLTCPPDALFGQDSHEGTASWSAATSDLGPTEQYKVYENFSAVSGDIQQVHFWGLNLSWSGGWSNCDTENPMDFLIEFWDDVGGVPGTVQYGETISVLGSATGELYAGYPSYEYLAVLTTPVSGLAAGWVSIQGASIVGPPDCWFMWMSGYGLDGDSLQWDGTALTNTLYDRALCLEGVYIPTYGACCDDYTGLCDDNVEYLVCLASGGRFAEGVLCINLDPPCGPTGACCDADLVCLFTCVEADCDAVGGTWWEGEDCDAGFVCPATCEHTVTLWDSYGDGWNGNTLDVLVNGVLVLDDITILDGYGPESHIFLAATGDTITTVFTGTSWPEENCYKIYDVNMIEICRDGYDGDECYGNPPVGVTCTGNCGPPPRGACCDDSTGICTDDVSILDCPEPLRFAQDTFCIDLDPPCGGIPGACCLDGVCEATLTESDCYTLYPGATWFEWEECPGFPCPPGNDTCETAMAINEVTDLPFDTTNATTSGLGTHSINQDIFYCFTAPQDGACMFELCGSTFDTRLAVWDDCACPPTVELAYNDDNGPACSGTQSSVELSVIAGMRYLVQVGGYSDYSGPGDLTIYMRQPGACCVGIVCTIETPVSCEALGGIYLGDGTDCGPPNPCLGTCCTINVDTYPYTDDVEGGFGDWQNAFVGDDTDWTWNAGSTPSSNTGPSGDHTTGAGYYFFIEASSHTDEVAILDGPCFDLTPLATPGVVFWYHMYGDDMGTLEFQVSDDGCVTWVTLWTLSGDQGDQWYMAQVSLAGYTDVATRFVGTTGPGFASDMALDDIWVGDVGAVTGACCVGTTCTVETEDYCVNTLLGYYLGDFTNCDAPNPCSGACCDLFDCFMTSNEGDCIAAGGTEWALGETCPEYVCWPYCDICFTETGDPDDWITNVRFNTIDNTTGPEGEPCSYGDYTSISTPVAPGTTYTLEVSFDGSGTWSECVTAFFDWNRDGVFDNVTERYDLGCADCTPGTPVTVTGDITVPGDADFGLTGMRVIEQYSSPVTDPCTGSTYGETEDYLVDIQPVPGACCYPDGSCDEQLPDDCATLGGVYGGATTVCANDDCNANGVDDFCDILAGTSPDCNENGVPDECDIASGFSEDCNSNGIPDECDVASGTSEDCQPNGIPDECEVPPICPGCPDCNTNGIPDECEEDCQPNGVPDDCDVDPTDPDGNGEVSEDCQPDGIPDECQLGDGRADMIIHTSARGLNNPGGHLVALLDETGTMYGQYNQIAAAQGSTWGYRDGAYDGEYVYFGWDTGVAQHDPDGANGVQIITGGAPSGVGTWRALAYDPTSSFGAPGFWVACWASDLIKVDMAGNLLQAWPDDGWSLYGLAYDEATG
ncbi:MAG: hypothetical protein KAY37_07560, partial [Phycisphaerae bacterium]|nr:hypothetical protein [Phycisphaerae bacterium]